MYIIDFVFVSRIYSAVIFLKFCLWLYCRQFRKSPIAQALAQDHINDVGSNSVALAALVVASEFPKLSLLDPVGAIIISLWIIWSWYDTGKYAMCFLTFLVCFASMNQFQRCSRDIQLYSHFEGRDEVRKLVGRQAPDEYLDELRVVCENHHPHADLDVLRGYHIGRNFLVEVEMIMDKDTTLEVSQYVKMYISFLPFVVYPIFVGARK